MVMQDTAIEVACPICGGRAFEAVKNRPNDRCSGCGSLRRTRAVWLLLSDHCKVMPAHRIAHFAPEKAISDKLMPLCGANYEAYDFAPARYKFANAKKIDLCTDLGALEDGGYDLVIHNHVLEHVPCNYTVVLLGLHALLKPGGYHVFSVPILSGHSGSDMDPALTRGQKLERFGQHDHIRRFGKDDFHIELGSILGITRDYNLSRYVPADRLLASNVPPAYWQAQATGTVFVVRKD